VNLVNIVICVAGPTQLTPQSNVFLILLFFQHLTASDLYNRDLDRGQCEFVGDPSVHPLFATTNDDYRFVVYG